MLKTDYEPQPSSNECRATIQLEFELIKEHLILRPVGIIWSWRSAKEIMRFCARNPRGFIHCHYANPNFQVQRGHFRICGDLSTFLPRHRWVSPLCLSVGGEKPPGYKNSGIELISDAPYFQLLILAYPEDRPRWRAWIPAPARAAARFR